MTEPNWTAVDAYFNEHLLPPDPVLQAALEASAAAGLPSIAVAPNQGKLLMLLAQSVGATRVLEIGTLGGYSTIWLGRGLPKNGRLISLELEARHAVVARGNIDRAGLSGIVEVKTGRAIDLLPHLAEQGQGPFDLVFIDADKTSSSDYFDWAVKLARPGGLIVVDNVVRDGAVVDGLSQDPSVQGVRHLITHVQADSRVDATVIQTVGEKGHDGFLIARVR
jgi:predicted O-methyltransferase YrrM